MFDGVRELWKAGCSASGAANSGLMAGLIIIVHLFQPPGVIGVEDGPHC